MALSCEGKLKLDLDEREVRYGRKLAIPLGMANFLFRLAGSDDVSNGTDRLLEVEPGLYKVRDLALAFFLVLRLSMNPGRLFPPSHVLRAGPALFGLVGLNRALTPPAKVLLRTVEIPITNNGMQPP